MATILLSIIIVLCVIYCVFGASLYLLQPKFLYGPVWEVTCSPANLGLDFDSVFFKSTDDLQLNGCYIPARSSDVTILFCHGNAGNIMHHLDSIDLFAK